MQRPEGYRCAGSHYGYPRGMARVEVRRKSAEERAEARAMRSAKDQLAIIASRPGESRRETMRLRNIKTTK